MTDWTDTIVESGSGFIAYRLMVEGWPHQWVTDARIVHEASPSPMSRKVYPGLSFEGLRISERAVLREAWPEVDSMTVRIVPTDSNEDTLNGFTRDPKVVAHLVNPMTASSIGWVTRRVLLPDLIFHLGSECVRTTPGLSIDGQSIDRGFWDTELQDHTPTEGAQDNPVPIYNWPPTMEGRRAYLYAYGVTDAPTSDGQVIWRGVVARPPAMDADGVSWTIEILPITSKFDQTVGAADELEYKIRGIYHSSVSPIRIGMLTTNGGDPEVESQVIEGFFESENDLTDAINTALLAMLATATGNAEQITAITCTYANGKYSYLVETESPATDNDFPLWLWVSDVIDGCMSYASPGDPRPNGQPPYAGVRLYAGDPTGALFNPFMSQKPPWDYPLPAARTLVGDPVFNLDVPEQKRFFFSYPTTHDDEFPRHRVYMESVNGIAVDDVLMIKNGEDGRLMRVTVVDTDDRFLDVVITGPGDGGIYISSESKVVPMRAYGENSNWAGFIEDIVAQSPTANLGKSPWITDRDVDTTNWTGYLETYPLHNFWQHRSYAFVKQVRVRDVWAPELAVSGWMARLAADGRVDVTLLPFISGQRSAQWVLTDDEILLPADQMVGIWPTWQAQTDGLVNIVKLRVGYDPMTDDFIESGDYTVRLTQSIAEHKSGDRASQELAIRSQASAYVPYVDFQVHVPWFPQRVQITARDVVDMLTPYLRALSQDYAIVTVAVPFTMFGVLVGDIVEVTSALIPDGFGGRGVTGKKAICVGRSWELDPVANAMGTLTLYFARDSGRIAGYAPTGRVSSQVDLGGDAWRLNFSMGNQLNAAWSESLTASVTVHFAIGDVIQLVEADTLTPVIVKGTVTGKTDATHIDVQLTETWVPGSVRWNLRYYFPTEIDVSLTLTLHEAQYCWVADVDGVFLQDTFIDDFPSAREFA